MTIGDAWRARWLGGLALALALVNASTAGAQEADRLQEQWERAKAAREKADEEWRAALEREWAQGRAMQGIARRIGIINRTLASFTDFEKLLASDQVEGLLDDRARAFTELAAGQAELTAIQRERRRLDRERQRLAQREHAIVKRARERRQREQQGEERRRE